MPAQTCVGAYKYLHIFVFSMCTAVTLTAMVCYRTMNQKFNKDIDKCILFTRPWVDLNPTNKRCRIDLSKTEWTTDTSCNFVLFTLLASFVYGIIAVWFFTMCSTSGRGTSDHSVVNVWKIVPPSFAASILLFVLTLLMAIYVSMGLSAFFGDLNAGKLTNCSAKTTGPIIWDTDSDVEGLSYWRKPSEGLVWVVVIFWGVATLTLLCRCVSAADFSTDEQNQLLCDEESSGMTETTNIPT